jgi:hypothetical protein
MLSVVMPSDIRLRDIILKGTMLSVVMLSDIMLRDIILKGTLLSVAILCLYAECLYA